MISASGGQGRGVVWVATLQRGGGSPRWLTRWRTLLTTTTLLSQRAPPRWCGRGLAWKALLDTGWHGFPASAATTVAGRRPACPRLARRVVAPHGRGRKWRERPPPFWPLVRHRAGGGGAPLWSHHLPSPAGVAPSTLIPAGRPSSRLGSRQRKSSRQQMALRPRGARLEDAHNPISPIRTPAGCHPA